MTSLFRMKELENLKKIVIPKWEEIPNRGLYKVELIKFVRGNLSPLFINDENFITSSMINNYVKQGHIKEPVNKKYYRDSIAQLLAIVIFKQAIQIDEISKGIAIELRSFTIRDIYDNFVEVFLDAKNKVLRRFGHKITIDFEVSDHHDKVLYYLAISLFTKLYTTAIIKNR
ncbi:DUF1836 domain-containing protein [Atopobacter sp. AH10]|uniref:DUF1836 domain-containing protein n=1 Tax=Atopobacter sp. AH10 TaxID=2315861 RepID=UPI000EF26D3E|nr:DUF1836 domain-containing protein [Atopobacter sp. AH10]RLK63048.1 DUF1836 domain-containing protein [Atopobacter sp. AH10]